MNDVYWVVGNLHEVVVEVDSCQVMEDGNHLLGQWWWNGVWWVVDSLHEVDNFEVVGIHLMEQLLLHEMCVVVDTCFLFQQEVYNHYVEAGNLLVEQW